MTAWYEYAARGRNSALRYVVATPLALAFAIGIGVVLALILVVGGVVSASQIAQLNSPAQTVLFFAGIFASFALVLAGFIVVVRLVHGKRVGDVLGDWRWRSFLTGFAVWTFAQVLATGADVLVSPHALRLSMSRGTLDLMLAATPALLLQTFTEEFVFRGYFTQGLTLLLRRPALTSLASAVVFAAAHLPNGQPQAAGALLFGWAMAYAAMRTGGLAFGFGVHLANNLFGSIVVVSDGDVFAGLPAVITEHASNLAWWDVGVEGVLLAVLTGLLVWLTPRGGASIPELATLAA